MAADQEEIRLVLEAIAQGLGDISRLASELRNTGDAADETDERLNNFDSAVDDLKGRITNLKNTVGDLAGAFLSVETVQYIADQIKAAAETKRFADSIGLATESLSGYQATFGKVGVASDETNDAIGSLTEKVYEAAEAGSDASELFSALGVTVTDASGQIKSTDQVLGELADGMKNSGDATANSAVALGLFGDVGLKLLPVLTQGAEGIQELTDAAKENGEVLTNEQAAAAEKAAAALAQMSADLAAAGRELAITFAPAVEYGTAGVRSLIDVVDFLGKSLGNLAFSITNLDWSGFQERQSELFDELTAGLEKNFEGIGKAGQAIEEAGRKAQESAKQTEEFGWNLTIAGRAAADLGGTLDEILEKPIDSNGVTQLGLALEVAGKQAGNTSTIIEDQLNASIANLSNDQLQKLRQSSEQAFDAGRLKAEQYDAILKSISTGALAQLGVDTEKLSSGFTAAENDALDLFQTVTDSAQSSATAIQAGLLQTLQSIESPAGLAELQARFDALKESGRLTDEQLVALSPTFDQITAAVTAGLEPGAEFDGLLSRLKDTAAQTAAGVSGLEQAYKALGLTLPATLQDTADAAGAAFAAIAAGTEDLGTQKEAWLVYADAALKAANAAGEPAPKLLEQQSAALGLTATYAELQRSLAAASPEFDAITAAMDRQQEIASVHLDTLQQEITLQGGVADAATAAAIARGDETAAAEAAVQASQSRIDSSVQEADALLAVAQAAQAKLAALQAEKELNGELSPDQERQIELLREEVTQKTASAEAARSRAVAVQTEEESTGRLTAALDAALAAVQSQYQPQVDLAAAKVETAQAALQAAEAAGDEAEATDALVALKQAEADQSRLTADLKAAEAQAARDAAAAVQEQAAADGLLTEAERQATVAAEASVEAKEKAAETAAILAEETEKAADAARDAADAAGEQVAALEDAERSTEKLRIATVKVGDQFIAAFGDQNIRAVQSAIESVDRWLIDAGDAAERLGAALDGGETRLLPLITAAETLAGRYKDAQGYNDDLIQQTREQLKTAIEAANAEMLEFAATEKDALADRLKGIQDYKAEGDALRQEEIRHERELADLQDKLALARQQGNKDAQAAILAQITAENELHSLKMGDLAAEETAAKNAKIEADNLSGALSKADDLIAVLKGGFDAAGGAASAISLSSAIQQAQNLAGELSRVQGSMSEAAKTASGDLLSAIADAKSKMKELAEEKALSDELEKADQLISTLSGGFSAAKDAAGLISMASAVAQAQSLAADLSRVQGSMAETAKIASENLLQAITAAKAEMKAFADEQKLALADRLKAIQDYKAEGDKLRQEELRHERELAGLQDKLALARNQSNTEGAAAILDQIAAENELHALKMADLKKQKEATQEIADISKKQEAATVAQDALQNLNEIKFDRLLANLAPVQSKLEQIRDLVKAVAAEADKI